VRTVPAPTLVGLSAPVLPAAAAATVAALASPSESEPTQISLAPQPETRVPAVAFTLPANPLSDLDAVDLASFIDFTLLETQGVDPVSPTAAPAAPAARARARLERAQRIARRGWPYASCVLAGLLVGLLLRSGPKAAPARVAPVVAAPKPASPPEIAPPSPSPAAAPETAGEARTGARGACVARVTTTPAGASVIWGGVALGPSPIEHAAIPCGRAVVTLKRERYADVTRTITAERAQAAVLSERMNRPPAKVLVTSTPPNALIRLNKHAFGATPRRISTLRFEHVRIQASLPGYHPWSKTVYLKDADTKVDVTLAPIAKPNARRGAAARPR